LRCYDFITIGEDDYFMGFYSCKGCLSLDCLKIIYKNDFLKYARNLKIFYKEDLTKKERDFLEELLFSAIVMARITNNENVFKKDFVWRVRYGEVDGMLCKHLTLKRLTRVIQSLSDKKIINLLELSIDKNGYPSASFCFAFNKVIK